jgi:hypothetical protein
LQTYRTRGGEINKQDAIKAFTNGIEPIGITSLALQNHYIKNMPLVHLSQQGGKESNENFYLTFHWEGIRPDVAKDIEMAQKAQPNKQ